MVIKNMPHLSMRRPQPLLPFHTKRRDQFYEFYQDFGHDTESRRELRDFIEDLISRGYMKQFVVHKERARLEPVRD